MMRFLTTWHGAFVCKICITVHVTYSFNPDFGKCKIFNFSDEPQTGLLDNPSNLVKNGHKSASIIMIIIGNESSLNPRNVVHSRNRSYTNELTIFLRKKNVFWTHSYCCLFVKSRNNLIRINGNKDWSCIRINLWFLISNV